MWLKWWNCFGWVKKNIVGEGENAGHHHILFSTLCLESLHSQVIKCWDSVSEAWMKSCLVEGKNNLSPQGPKRYMMFNLFTKQIQGYCRQFICGSNEEIFFLWYNKPWGKEKKLVTSTCLFLQCFQKRSLLVFKTLDCAAKSSEKIWHHFWSLSTGLTIVISVIQNILIHKFDLLPSAHK